MRRSARSSAVLAASIAAAPILVACGGTSRREANGEYIANAAATHEKVLSAREQKAAAYMQANCVPQVPGGIDFQARWSVGDLVTVIVDGKECPAKITSVTGSDTVYYEFVFDDGTPPASEGREPGYHFKKRAEKK